MAECKKTRSFYLERIKHLVVRQGISAFQKSEQHTKKVNNWWETYFKSVEWNCTLNSLHAYCIGIICVLVLCLPALWFSNRVQKLCQEAGEEGMLCFWSNQKVLKLFSWEGKYENGYARSLTLQKLYFYVVLRICLPWCNVPTAYFLHVFFFFPLVLLVDFSTRVKMSPISFL